MSDETPTTTDKKSDIIKVEQVLAVSKDALTRRQVNIKMVQNLFLVWLDDNIDESNSDCQNTIGQLRHVVNSLEKFTDSEECIQFLENIRSEKVCMIISGPLGKFIIPRVHSMSQVDYIFIFCSNKEYHQQWTQEWSKIKGIFTEITSICDALKQVARQCEHDSISISFMATTDDMSNKKLDQLEPSFMYTQIMKEILLTIKFEEKHFEEFLDHCGQALADNMSQLHNLDKLKREYYHETPVWWYTYECFLYPMLNRALRILDADVIVKLGFFIKDLHLQIEQLHKEQFAEQDSSESFILYRGQGVFKEEFEKMMQTKGGLLSFNCFLSTSKNRAVSSLFAESAATNPNLVGLLFVMTIHPSQSTTPFAAIGNVSYYRNREEEVLFAMHTVFRIDNVTPIGENLRLFRVDLTLTSDNDPDLRLLTDRIREETSLGNNEWERLGLVLLKMGEFEKAEEVYRILLEKEITQEEKACIYNQIGKIKDEQGQYQDAIKYYEESLEIRQQSLPSNHPDLAVSYNNIGSVYFNTGEYPKALSYYEKALEIRQQSLPSNHLDLALSYASIGNVYGELEDHVKELLNHEKALEIKQQSLPSNHPDLAISYTNIGNAYGDMGDYVKELAAQEKALAIRQQSLPVNHPDLASSYNNIGIVYKNMGEYAKALSAHEKALEIRQQSLPLNHPDLASSSYNIGRVYEGMTDYLKARLFYEQAINIAQQSLPANHPKLQMCKNSLDRVEKQL